MYFWTLKVRTGNKLKTGALKRRPGALEYAGHQFHCDILRSVEKVIQDSMFLSPERGIMIPHADRGFSPEPHFFFKAVGKEQGPQQL